MMLEFGGNKDSVAYDPNVMREDLTDWKQPAHTTSGSKTRRPDAQSIKAIATLLCFADWAGYKVRFCDFQANDGRIKGQRIGIREGMTEQETAFTLAHEIAHGYLHYDIDTINSPKHEEYEEQADRIASLLLDLIKFLG